jgi:hypothetical protein
MPRDDHCINFQRARRACSGPLADQTVLHSLLDRIRELNLRLIPVTEVEAIADDQ